MFNYEKLKRNKLIQIGLISLFLYSGISYLSKYFHYGEGFADRPIILFLSLYLLLFIFYFLSIRVISENKNQKNNLKIIFLFAFLFRLALLPSTPIQEDDFYRYLWDGKVTRSGLNPYKYSPLEISNFEKDSGNTDHSYNDIRELEKINLLRFENSRSEIIFDRVNHPEVPTIYPPISQGVFLFADFISAGGLLGLRLILLLFDLLTLWMVFRLLKKYKIGTHYSIIYAWSPLVIKELVNSLHIDAVPLLFLTLSLCLLATSRHVLSVFVFSLSVLSKLYSLILFPLIFATIREREGWRKMFIAGFVLIASLSIFYLPFLNEQWSVFEGLKTYGSQWERNDSLFALIKYATGDHEAAALLAAALFIIILGYITLAGENLVKKILIVLSVFFLLSPTQYPWYFISLLPFLCCYPNRALIFLSGLLSLYYLEFYFIYHEVNGALTALKWCEYLPFYILLMYDIVLKCGKLRFTTQP